MTSRIYSRGKKLWIPYSGFRFPPPRLIQLFNIFTCWITRKHNWSRWRIETEDWFEYIDEPIPWAWHICKRCDLTERIPGDNA